MNTTSTDYSARSRYAAAEHRDYLGPPAAAGQSSWASHALKRTFDVCFSLAALLVTSPLLAAAIIGIRLESRGPALFRQQRLGKNGRLFEMVKLRGMYSDARERFPELYDYAVVAAGDTGDYYFHSGDRTDPRVTRVGRIVRRYSIDELPNFWNVLRGDMSVVGPRPEIPELTHLYTADELSLMLSVRPGVTSPAKASGRDDISYAENIERELDYVRNRSFRLDVETIVRTAQMALRGGGVR